MFNKLKKLQDILAKFCSKKISFIRRYFKIKTITVCISIAFVLFILISPLTDILKLYSISLSPSVDTNSLTLPQFLSLKEYNVRIVTLLVAIFGILVATWRIISQERSFLFEKDKFASQQLNERYSKAVELLGNNEIAVRIGALHTLRILADQDAAYYQAFIDITKGYIKSELDSDRLQKEEDSWRECLHDWQDETKELMKKMQFKKAYASKPYKQFPEDLKIALSALVNKKGEELIDFQNTDWVGFDFGETEIKIFRYIDFSKSNFDHTHFANEQIFEHCRGYPLSFNNAHLQLPRFSEPYIDPINGQIFPYSIIANNAYFSSFHMHHYMGYSHITNSIFDAGTFLEGKNSRPYPINESVFNRVNFYFTHFTFPFKNCAFVNCFFQDSETKVYDTEEKKNRTMFNNVFFIDCEDRKITRNYSMFNNVKNENLPKENYQEKNVEIIFLDSKTYRKSKILRENFSITQVSLDKGFYVHVSAQREAMTAFLDGLNTIDKLFLLVQRK